MPEEAFSQRPVEALHDALVPVDVNPTASNLGRVLCEQLTDGAHELAPRVNLKELRPPQRAPLINPSKGIGHLCRSFLSGSIEVFQQPDKLLTCGSHGPRSLSSFVVLCCFNKQQATRGWSGQKKNTCCG